MSIKIKFVSVFDPNTREGNVGYLHVLTTDPVTGDPFTVSTEDDLNALSRRTDGLIATLQDPGGVIDERVSAEHERAKAEVAKTIVDAVDKLPQRLLTDEARDAIKMAILDEVSKKLDGLKEELGERISKLEAQFGGLPPHQRGAGRA